ncbi:MaoC family dehydratase [Pigmentiphaga litoralis]|uniref:MaoC family dehydratase n=1 Tax=Pigmentiphaga litoralis TaxID=516702 RepID=UPI0016737A9D|nr:MaoC family dehydratase [Pigmentiphaga litoralis]GGX16855.1 MaoC family dehydratase [Pigmentiphaga litoralis]
MRHFDTLNELIDHVGTEVAVSDWLVIDHSRIDRFADATGDHAWIHVDPARAATGPFGAPVAHGFLTLSLIPLFAASALHIADVVTGVNYGLNRVRFVAPVPVNSRLRARFTLTSIEMLPETAAQRGAQAVWAITIDIDGAGKPACLAEFIARYGV